MASYLDSISSQTSALRHHPDLEEKTKTMTSNMHFILGNEAGDADSIVSALTLGYIMTLEDHYYEDDCFQSGDNTNNRRVVVPIAPVPRVDLPLRRDVVLLLELSGFNIAQLPCLDDECIAMHLEEPKEGLTLTLVDHNRIRSTLLHLSELVTEILDHHEDEGYHLETTSSATSISHKRVIAFEAGWATVASTCTLVVERLFVLLAATSKKKNAALKMTKIDGSLGLLLLGVILLDTINMSPSAGRGTLRDAQAITILLEQTDWSSLHCQQQHHSRNEEPSHALLQKRIFTNHDNGDSSTNCGGAPNTTALFELLSNSRSDKKYWMEASVSDCLRMDYKKFTVSSQSSSQSLSTPISSIGLSTVLLSMDDFRSKHNFCRDLSTYITLSDVDLLGVLTLELYENDDGTTTAIRGLLLASFHREVVDSYTAFLLNGPEAAFLELVDCSATTKANIDDIGCLIHIRVFQQGNARMGRKQIAPILLLGATPRQKN